MANDANQLVELIRELVRAEAEKQDCTVKCIVQTVNPDKTIDAFLVTDLEQTQNTLLRGLTNMSRYNFVKGDIAILYKMQNNINNSFIIGKVGKGDDAFDALATRMDQLTLGAGGGEIVISGSGGGGGGGQTQQVIERVDRFGDLLDIVNPSSNVIYFVKNTETAYLYTPATNTFDAYTPYGVQGLIAIDGGAADTTNYSATNYNAGFGSVKTSND